MATLLYGKYILISRPHYDEKFRLWFPYASILREGRFDQDRMLALIEQALAGGGQQGFPLTRLVAHMEWALEDRPGRR